MAVAPRPLARLIVLIYSPRLTLNVFFLNYTDIIIHHTTRLL